MIKNTIRPWFIRNKTNPYHFVTRVLRYVLLPLCNVLVCVALTHFFDHAIVSHEIKIESLYNNRLQRALLAVNTCTTDGGVQ